MRISPAGLELLKRFEAFEPRVYKDAVGLDTIGYGHLVTPEDVRTKRFAGVVLTKETALQLLQEDLKVYEIGVSNAIRNDVLAMMPANQFDALVIFAFNVGMPQFKASTLLKKVNASAPTDEIIAQFRRWIYGTKEGKRVALKGLKNRRELEIALYLGKEV